MKRHTGDRSAGAVVRVNGAIRANEVRVVGVAGENLGIMPRRKALDAAAAADMDLVEIAPNAEPPVCRIVDYGKWQYQKGKSRKTVQQRETKEVQLGVRIGEADLRTKCRKIVESLSRGDRVRVIITFKGREITHPELADTLIDRVKDAVGGSGRLEHDVRRDGKRITFSYIPLQ